MKRVTEPKKISEANFYAETKKVELERRNLSVKARANAQKSARQMHHLGLFASGSLPAFRCIR